MRISVITLCVVTDINIYGGEFLMQHRNIPVSCKKDVCMIEYPQLCGGRTQNSKGKNLSARSRRIGKSLG